METILLAGQEEFNTLTGCNNKFVGIPYFDWHNLREGETLYQFINDANDRFGHHFHDSLGQNTAPLQFYSDQIRNGALANLRHVRTGEFVRRGWTNGEAKRNLDYDLHARYPLHTDYTRFCYALEGLWNEQLPGLHNDVHNIIGGDVAGELASNDPIFFTHHANIDKIWGDWQKQSDLHKDAFVTGWSKDNRMPDESTATVQDVLDLNNLRYMSPIDISISTTVRIEYVDLDTSVMWGRGNTLSIDLEYQTIIREMR